jgi:hypothetical protein
MPTQHLDNEAAFDVFWVILDSDLASLNVRIFLSLRIDSPPFENRYQRL